MELEACFFFLGLLELDPKKDQLLEFGLLDFGFFIDWFVFFGLFLDYNNFFGDNNDFSDIYLTMEREEVNLYLSQGYLRVMNPTGI